VRSHFSEDAPHWHKACYLRRNGSEHETSRTLCADSHPVSLTSRAASRCITPGLRRARRFGPDAAPSSSSHCGDGRAGGGLGASGRAADLFRDGSPTRRTLHCELERGWNFGRKRDGGNDRRAGLVYVAPANLPAPATFTVQATSLARPHQEFATSQVTDDERYFRERISPPAAPVELGASRALHRHGEFRRESQPGSHLDALGQWLHRGAVRDGGRFGNVHGPSDLWRRRPPFR
jgi:hypothetical protein